MTHLEAAYQEVRAHLHQTGTGDPDELRSLLWIVAEAVERWDVDGWPLREIGDGLTGVKTSEAPRGLIGARR